jgi:hypothetical protein
MKMPRGMMSHGVMSAAAVVACAGAALGDGASAGSLADLMAAYPQARVHREGGVVSMVYGTPMSAGATASEAALSWMANFAGVFGNPELTLNAQRQLRDGYFTVYDYRQQVKGVPVEYGMLKVVVLNAPGEALDRVVFASGNIARVPAGFSVEPTVTPEAAVSMVGGMPEYIDLPEFGEATLAIWFGDGDWGTPALAWKFVGEYVGPAGARRYTFFVDAQSGDLLRAQTEIHYDITGTVTGNWTPGILPDSVSNPAVSRSVPQVRVDASPASVQAESSRDGLFTLVFGGGAAQTVSSSLTNGRWSSITTAEGTVLTASQSGVVAPGPANLIFNPTPSEFPTSQVNAFIHTNLIHNYIDDRADFPEIDLPLQTNTNFTTASGITGCNAFFTTSGGIPQHQLLPRHQRMREHRLRLGRRPRVWALHRQPARPRPGRLRRGLRRHCGDAALRQQPRRTRLHRSRHQHPPSRSGQSAVSLRQRCSAHLRTDPRRNVVRDAKRLRRPVWRRPRPRSGAATPG